jgi:hypothetical protein
MSYQQLLGKKRNKGTKIYQNIDNQTRLNLLKYVIYYLNLGK